MTTKNARLQKAIGGGVAATALAVALASAPASAIVPNNNQTPAQIVDTAGGVNGVGMFFRNDGFVCTGTLINPRTVLFAAHCVNDRLATDYSSIDGVVPAAFSFNVDARPGFQNWAANAFRSNSALNVFNISQIQYDPRSLLNPQALGFLEADIALATLDTPAANIPTWALLFSPLPTPGSIDPVKGTGYHVNITGYGRSGNGTQGAVTGVDFRRRAAENMLGALASLDDRDAFLFGPAGPGDPTLGQNLYQLDFDDPRRGTAGASPFDLNIHRDDALAREGTTAGGDSGGPLILDAANNTLSTKDLQIGVLSGGSRFFGPQAFSSYGTTSFYQPLYLFWDYIAATNPYRYVTAAAGNGNWEDASRWVTTLDPNYNIINAAGQVVNGVPTGLGLGIDGGDPDFGQVCIQGLGLNECRDLSTGEDFTPVQGTVGGAVASGIGRAELNGQLTGGAEQVSLSSAVASSSDAAADATAAATPAAATTSLTRGDMINSLSAGDNAVGTLTSHLATADLGTGLSPAASAESLAALQKLAEEAQRNGSGVFSTGPLPTATLANGLPGATGFVPNNVNPNNVAGTPGRYFDVTLGAAGTTTLSSTVTIDRLTVANTAGLTIAGAGNLTSLIDVTQTGGSMNVNGRLTSVGDYTLASGLLTGTGTIKTPFLTSIMGTIAPGGIGTIGTLTVDGSLVMSSASQFLVDVGAATSDRLAITGDASLGGRVIVSPVSGYTIKNGDTYRIVTTGGTISAGFNSAAPISALLTPVLTTSSNAVDVRIVAQAASSVIDRTSAVQRSFASIIDSNRAQDRNYSSVYLPLDLLGAGALRSTLEGLAPITETSVRSSTEAMLTATGTFHRNRTQSVLRGSYGGTVTTMGQPLQMASLAASAAFVNGDAAATAAQGAEESVVEDSGLGEDFAVYLVGGYRDGRARSAPAAIANGRSDRFDGLFIVGGMEYLPGDGMVLGASVSYSDLDTDAAAGQTTKADLIEGSIYGAVSTTMGLVVDGRLTVGKLSVDTARTVAIGASTFNLASQDSSLSVSSELGLSAPLVTETVVVTPRVAAQYLYIGFDDVSETGGGPALTIERDSFESLQIRAGATMASKAESIVSAYVYGDFVYDVLDGDAFFGANFVGSNAGRFPFALASDSTNWFEVGAGVSVDLGSVKLTAAVDTTLGRSDFQAQQYSLAARFRF